MEEFIAPKKGIPTPPEHFDKQHIEKWESVCTLLEKFDLLFELDYDALAMYVENWVIARIAWDDLQKNGMTIYSETFNKDGDVTSRRPVTNPAFRQYQDAMKVVQPLQDKFGLNIRARMAIKVEPPKKQKDSPIMALLTKRKTA